MALALAWLVPAGCWAQANDAAAEPALVLRSSPRLAENFPPRLRQELPTFISGDRLSGRPDLDAEIDGHASLRRGDLSLRADRLYYDQPQDQVRATGQVHINRGGNVYDGTELELRLDAFQGYFLHPRYRFLQNGAEGQGSRIDFVDDKRSTIHNATYSTCKRQGGPDWLPEWMLRATAIHFDTQDDSAIAEGAVLQFQGVPVLPLPALSFPLGDKRKSGWLAPMLEQDSVSGLVLTTPYYWNIAPQWDATFSPTALSRRGLNLGTEFRYLLPAVQGTLRADLMPQDSLRPRSRWGLSMQHAGQLPAPVSDSTPIGFHLQVNRVSDDNYWRDFPRAIEPLNQRLLASDVNLSWARGDFSATLRTQSWQSLQDATAPIVPPYDRLPQLELRYARSQGAGWDFGGQASVTRFVADSALTRQVNGLRSLAAFQASYPWLAPGGFVVPKVQWHATQYHFDAPLANGSTSAARTLPTFSLDSGLVFERDVRFQGRSMRQTLEPRAMYVRTPYRDQSHLPNYDSALQDFNFASIFSENAFLGNDRVSDSNLLTLGLTSRWLDTIDGAEAARLGLAQRLRFKDQNVTLPGAAPVRERISDIMLGASVNWNPQWSFDSTLQFNPKISRSQSMVMGGFYNPAPFHVVSAAYRLQRGLSEQVNLGWQWPLNLSGPNASEAAANGRWYTVGRLNYSLQDRKLVDSVLGLEYDAGCWLGRVVLDRRQSSAATATTRLALQLEFVGFAKPSIGADPLKILKDNIPRYQYLREPGTPPSRFSQFD